MSVLGPFERLLDERARTGGRASKGDAEPRAWERTVQLAEALAATDRLRAILQDGFADRDRAFENVLSRFPNASPDRDRAERAEAGLAERTLQLAEVLVTASARADAFVEGLADRDLRFAALEALWEKRFRAESLQQTELRERLRRMEDRLEERSAQLAESLIAAERSRATMLDALRVYGEAFGLLRARLETDRRARIKPPNVARRFARALRRAVLSPLARAAKTSRSRLERR